MAGAATTSNDRLAGFIVLGGSAGGTPQAHATVGEAA